MFDYRAEPRRRSNSEFIPIPIFGGEGGLSDHHYPLEALQIHCQFCSDCDVL